MGLAGVGAEDAEPARVRENGDAVSGRRREGGQEDGGVEQLLQARRPQHARFAEERVDDDVRSRQGRGV